MQQPDWSKAPEGATHWDQRDSGKPSQWVRRDEDGYYYFHDGTRWEYWFICDAEKEMLVPRKEEQTWTGKGIPAIGTECECLHRIGNSKLTWVGCTVVGRFMDKIVCAPHGGGFYAFSTDELRPTKEQRVKLELAELIESHRAKSSVVIAEAIIERYELKEKKR